MPFLFLLPYSNWSNQSSVAGDLAIVAQVSGLYPVNGIEYFDLWSRSAKCRQQMEIRNRRLWTSMVRTHIQDILGVFAGNGFIRICGLVCGCLSVAAYPQTKSVVMRGDAEQALAADSP